MENDIEKIKYFSRKLGHSYNNEIFKINAFVELFAVHKNNPEKLSSYMEMLKRSVGNLTKNTEKLSHFAHTGEVLEVD